MIFEQTQRTPYVELTPQSCAIRGECYPENIAEWSGPVLAALEESMMLENSTFKVVIELYYFNSSSASSFSTSSSTLKKLQKPVGISLFIGAIGQKTTP